MVTHGGVLFTVLEYLTHSGPNQSVCLDLSSVFVQLLFKCQSVQGRGWGGGCRRGPVACTGHY